MGMEMECLFYATTTPGLEHVCGLIFRANPFMDFSQLKSICSLNALVGTLDTISTTDDMDTVLKRFRDYPLIDNDLWTKAYHIKHYFDMKHEANTPVAAGQTLCDDSAAATSKLTCTTSQPGGSAMSDAELWSHWSEQDERALCAVFRVSCTRKKDEHFPAHKFTSLQAAGCLGYGVGLRYPKWTVDLKQAHVDVIFHIMDNQGVIAINLIPEEAISQRHRAAPLFSWITALAPPTAFSLCALLEPHLAPGMVICDPMCGIGTIPIEGALAFPYCFFVGGELSAESMQQARANEQWTREQSKLRLRQGQRQGQRGQSSDPCSDSSDKNSSSSVVQPFSLNVEFVQWNAGSIPVRSGSVDIVVCDMPFGMKHGNYRLNRKLYPLFFREMLRILSENGKMLLLTLEMKLVRKTLTAMAAAVSGQPPCVSLYEHSSLPVTIGGFRTKIFDIRKKIS